MDIENPQNENEDQDPQNENEDQDCFIFLLRLCLVSFWILVALVFIAKLIFIDLPEIYKIPNGKND